MFFLYPDPHFKKAKHKWRIINPSLLAEYAYILGIGGKIYIVTDVEDLFEWMSRHLNSHPLFRKLTDEEQNQDPVVEKLWESTGRVRRFRGISALVPIMVMASNSVPCIRELKILSAEAKS